MDSKSITIQALIHADVEKVWLLYTQPVHVCKWNHASDDWHTPRAENDLRVGGKFLYRMEARAGDQGFDFWGIYDEVKTNQWIAYTLGDERKVKVMFCPEKADTKVVIKFEAENTHSIEQQHQGWQAILDNFKRYTEETL